MKNIFKYTAVSAGTLIVAAGIAWAGTIKTWNQGDIVRASDLGANFTHIHNTMVGGHGARLVDADVSSSAAIAHSKMATPALLPKAWAYVTNGSGTACGSSPCTLQASSRISGVTRSSTGVYVVTLSYTASDISYIPVISAISRASGSPVGIICNPKDPGSAAFTTTTFEVLCVDSGGTTIDAAFGFIVMDNNN